MNIILLAISMAILTFGCICMGNRVDRLERNQEFLVNFVNNLQKELMKNGNRNTNDVQIKKEQSEDHNKSEN